MLGRPRHRARPPTEPHPRRGHRGAGRRRAPLDDLVTGHLLAFEERPWRHAGAKEAAIRDDLGLSPVRYYQQLLAELDDPAAIAAHPATAARLRRLMQSRAAWRARR
nr:DUF3263 domain-containing protein [Nakamurella aerolata]